MSEMHYWNQANFRGLASLASAFRVDLRLESLARYCDLREKGLRKEAFAELDMFINEAQEWNVSTQQDVVLQILDGHWRTPHAHQFLAEPLRRRLVEPVLKKWIAAEQGNYVPLRELALLHGDSKLLYDSLRMNPNDDRVRAAIVRNLLKYVDYSTHHLSESLFIGKLEDSAAALSDASAVLNDVMDPSALAFLSVELRNLVALLTDWREYRAAPEGSFPEWCRARNRVHSWQSSVYSDGSVG